MKFSKIAVLVGLACTPWANANDVFTFDEVVVSATRTEQEIRDVAASVSTVTSEDIENSMSQNLQQALRSEPGVSMEGQGRFGLSGFNIRGREDNYVKVMVDGVQQSSTYDPSGPGYMNKTQGTIESDTLTAIEVNKGPVSSLYGSDAIAGAVIMRTFNPEDFLNASGDDSFASVKAGYASADDSYKTTFTLANRSGDWESLLMYTKRTGHETQTHSSGADITGRDRGQANPFDIEQDNLLAKLFYQVNDAHRIGVTAEVFNRDSEGSVLSEDGHSINMGSTIYYYDNNTNDDSSDRMRFSVEHSWQADNEVFDDLHWQLAWQRSTVDYNTYQLRNVITDGVDNISYLNRQREAEDTAVQFDATFNKGVELATSYHELTYGVNVVQNDFETVYTDHNYSNGSSTPANQEVPNAEALNWGVYIQDQGFYLDDRLVVNLGLRYDYFSTTPDSASGYDKDSNNVITGRVGSVYHWTDQFSTYAQVSQGFKAPTVQDRYQQHSTSGAEFIPNADLKAEESLAYEIGSRFAHRYGQVEASVFYNDYSNFINQIELDEEGGNRRFTKVNIDEARIYGAELSTHTDMAALVSAPEGTFVDVSVAYASGEDKATGEAIDTVAPLTAYAALGFDAPARNFGGRLSVEAVAGKDGSDWSSEDNIKAPGYAVTDVTAYYRPSGAMTLRAGVFNVFDKKYWRYNDLTGETSASQGIDRRTQPGRNWGVEFEYEF